jgi:outer membrane protein with beta-barrel domain
LRLLRHAAVALMLVGFASAPARAEGFIVPFIGFNFGGDSGSCATLTNCDERRRNFGVSLGAMGTVVGFEEDLSWANNFFGEIPDGENSVFSAMSNLLIGVGVGPVRPYVLGGAGLIRTHVTEESIASFGEGGNSFGYDVGGGITGMFGSHVGIRGDLRLFRTVQDLDFFSLTDEKLEFWRASVGLALAF